MIRRLKPNVACAGAVMVLALCTLPIPAYAQKLVFVVRHAERADGAMTQMQGQADPPLSARGEARAARLAEMLGEAGISAIYVTEFRRTRDTARPLAAKLHLASEQYPSGDTDSLIRKVRSAHSDDVVLVVGHSDTVPGIIKALGGAQVTISESDYDNLFIVVPGVGTTTRIRFTP